MKVLCMVIFIAASQVAFAQDSTNKIMEARTREMYRVVGLNDSQSCKHFIKENYTKALINKPMHAKIEGGAGGASSNTTEGDIEGKAKMYEMLHNDFAGSKITYLKTFGETVKMVVASGDMAGTFTLKFAKEAPYLIDGLGIDVRN